MLATHLPQSHSNQGTQACGTCTAKAGGPAPAATCLAGTRCDGTHAEQRLQRTEDVAASVGAQLRRRCRCVRPVPEGHVSSGTAPQGAGAATRHASLECALACLVRDAAGHGCPHFRSRRPLPSWLRAVRGKCGQVGMTDAQYGGMGHGGGGLCTASICYVRTSKGLSTSYRNEKTQFCIRNKRTGLGQGSRGCGQSRLLHRGVQRQHRQQRFQLNTSVGKDQRAGLRAVVLLRGHGVDCHRQVR